MKKQTHTPGHWSVSRLMATRVVSEVAPDDRLLVATCDPVKGKQTDAEAEANARLIAASPDLLGSLKDLMELMESTIESCGGHKSFFECDHSVNICSCHYRKIYEDAKELLEKFK